MGSSPYGKRDLVAVKAVPGATWYYGWQTNATEAQKTALGHVPGVGPAGFRSDMVIGANAPKPTRVRKYRAAATGVNPGFDTTFCDVSKITEAGAAGWTLVRKYKIRRGKAGIYYVDLALVNPETAEDGSASGGVTIKYAWNMPKFLVDKITSADKTALGITAATGNDADLVFGCSPKPPRATFTAIADTGQVGHRTTFVSSAKIDSLPTGWKAAS